MSKRTAHLNRVTCDADGTVDEVVIGSWFQMELMSAVGSFVYDLHLGDRHFSVIVPKNSDKPVEVVDVGQ